MLDGIRRPVARLLGELPAVLPLGRAEQAPQVGLGMAARFAAGKAWGEALGDRGLLLGRAGQGRDQLHVGSGRRGSGRGRDGWVRMASGHWNTSWTMGIAPSARILPHYCNCSTNLDFPHLGGIAEQIIEAFEKRAR